MATIRHRRASKAQWAFDNPILDSGEIGLEIGVGNQHDRFKIGNGLSPWNQLKYFINETEINIDVGRLSQEALDERYIRLPYGGTLKQVLVKSADGGLEWANMEAGEGSGDGPLAEDSPAYKDAALNTDIEALRIVTIGDSTNDGFGNPGGPDQWSKVWPIKMAAMLRNALGVNPGGRGWIPASTPLLPGSYVYRTAVLGPAQNSGYDELNFQTGMPGGLWMQEGHATNKYTATFNLSPGVTSVDVVTTRYGPGIIDIIPASGNSVPISGDATVEFTRIENPGTSVSLIPRAGVGYALYGIVEHVGDESTGVVQYNLSQGSTAAFEYASWMGNGAFTLKNMFSRIQPQLVLINLGANDFSRGRTVFEFTSAMTELRAQILQAVPNAVIAPIIRPWNETADTQVPPTATWNEFSVALLDWAATFDVTVLDLRSTFPAAGGLYLSDKVHFNEAGNTAYAETVLDFLKVDGGDSHLIDLINERYILPATGIPREDLSSTVQTTLLKANTAAQVGGEPGAGKVVTSDANGVLTLQPPPAGSGGGGGGPTPEVAFVISNSIRDLLPATNGVWQDWPGLSVTLPATDKAVYVELSPTTAKMAVNGRTQIRLVTNNNVELAIVPTSHFATINTDWSVPTVRARVAPHVDSEVVVRVQIRIAYFTPNNSGDAGYNPGSARYNVDGVPVLLSAT